nr:gamma-glutamyltransferase [Pseudovibrio flavus]
MVCLSVLLGTVSVASSQEAADSVAPEAATSLQQAPVTSAKEFMVVAANPYASMAGFEILKAGGNAIDAMVAVQLTLGLVEPQSSGIGGGAFLMYYDAVAGEITSYDGRETAPMAATPTLFQNDDGEPLKFWDAVVGGRSVGTPGTMRLIHDTHAKYGKLPWARVVEPAAILAQEGFEVSPRLNQLITRDKDRLSRFKSTQDYFFLEGKPLPVGHVLKNPAYAQTLIEVANFGPDAFYKGKVAEDIVKTVQTAEGNPGVLALNDLANYHVIQRDPVCTSYEEYEVCGMGPPSSGALTVAQILGLTEPYDLESDAAKAAQTWRVIGDASRLAFADRGRYMADSDYVPMPTKGLVSEDYLDERSVFLEGQTALPQSEVVPGTPTWDHAMMLADDESIELPSTSHFSIVDAEGNVVSMTTTIENGFGSRLMTNGFLLNNELTDFSFRTHKNGNPIANRVEPGKRPRSSMAPTIVMKDGKPFLAIGSPGGSRIIGYVATTLIAVLDWEMGLQEAIDMPHLVNRFGTYDLEKGTWAEELEAPLQELGYKTNIRDLNSGLHGIMITPEGLIAGVDPRREGAAFGQ